MYGNYGKWIAQKCMETMENRKHKNVWKLWKMAEIWYKIAKWLIACNQPQFAF